MSFPRILTAALIASFAFAASIGIALAGALPPTPSASNAVSQVTPIKFNRVPVNGPIGRFPFCFAPKQLTAVEISVPCQPGQVPPGGLFGNQCLATVYQCRTPPVIQ